MSILVFTIILSYINFSISLRIVYKTSSVFIYFPVIVIWRISCIAECNRAPLDFAEGESELVSGFNVEYGRGQFAIIFVAEYGIVVYFSLLTANLFNIICIKPFIIFSIIVSIILFVRSVFPRLRYDKLIRLA